MSLGLMRSVIWRASGTDERTPIIRRAPLHCRCPKSRCALLPRHTPQLLGPLLALGYLPTCPPHRGRPSSRLSGRLRWQGFCIQSHGRHPGPGPPRSALRRRPSWCGNDSTRPLRQLCFGSRAFHLQLTASSSSPTGTQPGGLSDLCAYEM